MRQKNIHIKNRIYNFVSILAALVFVTTLCIFLGQELKYQEYDEDLGQYSTIDVEEDQIRNEDTILPNKVFIHNPIDFTSLKERNSDVYAWITIPGLDISYPILQSSIDNYYLDKNIDKYSSKLGCIYTNSNNSKDFTDFNTIIYGHNVIDVAGNMFSPLHGLSDEKTFDKVKTIIIYTSNVEYVYDLYSVIRFYKNTYIPYEYNFSIESERQSFINMTFNDSKYDGGKLRENISVSTDDNLITLSTCMLDMNYRLLVVGKLRETHLLDTIIR